MSSEIIKKKKGPDGEYLTVVFYKCETTVTSDRLVILF